MKRLFTFVFLLFLGAPVFAQREVILPVNSTGWSYTRSLDESGQQIDATIDDQDFWETWFRHELGSYSSVFPYDGPEFVENAQAPFYAGDVPGITGGTSLDEPAGAVWKHGYFLKVIDGGETGYQNLELKMLARDGFFVFLNGSPLTFNNLNLRPLSDFEASAPGDGETFATVPFIINRFPTLRPGPNLLAVFVARMPTETEDFGFQMELTGEPNTDQFYTQGPFLDIYKNEILLRWATGMEQPSIVRLTNTADGSVELIQDGELKKIHEVKKKLKYGNDYSYALLDPELNIIGREVLFSVEKKVVIGLESDGWFYLQHRDENGVDVDPSIVDPDFNETWYRPEFSGVEELAAISSDYDGPEFTTGGETPLHYGWEVEFPDHPASLSPPAGGEGHTSWYYRIIDGGEEGYRNLESEVTFSDGYVLYLNGSEISRDGISGDDRWNNHARWYRGGVSVTQAWMGYLNPGPNLLAVSVHNAEGESDAMGFGIQIEGAEGRPPAIRDVSLVQGEGAFSMFYQTGFMGPTIVEYGIDPQSMEQVVIEGSRAAHFVELDGLKVGEIYHYEVKDFEGNSFSPPEVGRVPILPFMFLDERSSGWSVLHSLDHEGKGIDPTLADSDFLETWMTQGMEGNQYDGPLFTPDLTAPFYIAGRTGETEGTPLAHPGDNLAGALYLVREIDIEPGEEGYIDIDFKYNSSGLCYLNGRLIASREMAPGATSSWSQFAVNYPRDLLKIDSGFLRPGKNILAVSFHAENSNDLNFLRDLKITGTKESFPEMSPERFVNYDEDVLSVRWMTAASGRSWLKYGTSRSSLDSEIIVDEGKVNHEVAIPGLKNGIRYYYEILKDDGSSYEPPAVSSFLAPKKELISYGDEWYYLNHLDPGTEESVDPVASDPDFNETWQDQNIGGYVSGGSYDGPMFSGPAPAPFRPGEFPLDGFTTLKNSSTVWFLKEIDGGETGCRDLEMEFSTYQSGMIFLNGSLIGEINTQVESQAIWSQDLGSTYEREVILDPNLVIPPGPNLLGVVSFYQRSPGLDLTLKGVPIIPSFSSMPRVRHVSSDQAEIAWVTGMEIPTRVRWGKSPFHLDQQVNDLALDLDHELVLTNLDEKTKYFVEILNGDGSSFDPPQLLEFQTDDLEIVGPTSGEWALLESIVGDDFVDPETLDLDFSTTWFDQSIGGYPGSGFYDGPGFVSARTSPFAPPGVYRTRPSATILEMINGRMRPIWLLKEIDGGEHGYRDLRVRGAANSGFVFYLNGQKVSSHSMEEDAVGGWDEASLKRSIQAENFSISLPGELRLQEGSNLLAMSVHPSSVSNPVTMGLEMTLRGVRSRLSVEELMFEILPPNSMQMSWRNSSPSRATVRYGHSLMAPDHLVETSEFLEGHDLVLSGLIPNKEVFYEVTITDQEGNEQVSAGVFENQCLLRGPYLQKGKSTGMTIRWRTAAPVVSHIKYGTNPSSLDQGVLVEGNRTEHAVPIEGLEPDSRYFYEIEYGSNGDSIPASDLGQYFETSPLPGQSKPTRIWVVGDSGYAGDDVDNVYQAFRQENGSPHSDLWLMLGDNAYNTGEDHEYQVSVFETFPELLKNTPLWPTMGNHDYFSAAYYDIFDLPTQGESGGVPSGTEQYYSFDYGNIHFVCLNSEETPEGMVEWLKNDLMATRADWIIAFFHHGPYTKGSHNSDSELEHFFPRQEMLPILESFGVDLVLTGHSHQYERSNLLNGHYGFSNEYDEGVHAVDPGNGSRFGRTDNDSGLFRYGGGSGAYQKGIAEPESGQVSITVGSSSKLGSWTSGYTTNITNQEPHPVHVATLRALGSLVIDIEGHQLSAFYLDSDGRIRDEFEIQKEWKSTEALDWWQSNFISPSHPYISDWMADPDGDLENNQVEFAMGGDPFQVDKLLEAEMTTTFGEDGEQEVWFSVRFQMRDSVKFEVQASEDLVEFSELGVVLVKVDVADEDGLATWEARLLREGQRGVFFKVNVTR